MTDPIIDWILHNDDCTINPSLELQVHENIPSMNDTNLFDIMFNDGSSALLESDVPQPSLTETTSGEMTQAPAKSDANKEKQRPNMMPTAGRLDFRVSKSTDDYPTESQLKNMTSKERRQLRNKISARNFRNRRKEYITTLEEQVEQLKTENGQLKLKLGWMQNNMEKLQKENEQLRLDLLFLRCYHQNTTSLSPFLTSSSSSDDTTLFSSSPSPPTTMLSHATIPRWDLPRILGKDPSPVQTNYGELLSRYPLLGPALMSIVISHTMTMSANDLLTLEPSIDSKKDRPFIPHQLGLKQKPSSSPPVWQLLWSTMRENTEEGREKKEEKGNSRCSLLCRTENLPALRRKFCDMVMQALCAWLGQHSSSYRSRPLEQCA